ncbi:hypothetical protein F4604DRAFT_1768101, partial [Suillus subluteus]
MHCMASRSFKFEQKPLSDEVVRPLDNLTTANLDLRVLCQLFFAEKTHKELTLYNLSTCKGSNATRLSTSRNLSKGSKHHRHCVINFASAATKALIPPSMVEHPIASRVVSSTIIHRCESRNMTHCYITRVAWASKVKYTVLMLTQIESPQPVQSISRKHIIRQGSLVGSGSGSVADIDVVKAATTASTKGKCIVREEILLIRAQINLKG